MSKPPTAPTPPVDLAALELAALAEMTPRERLSYEMSKATLAAANEANRLAAANDRRDVAADAVVAEKVRTTGEKHDALAAGRKPARVRLEVPVVMDRLQGFPTAKVMVTATGEVRGDGEELAGEVILTSLSCWDMADTEKMLEADCMLPYAQQIGELVAAGKPREAEQLSSTLLGNAAAGFKGRRWMELVKPVHMRVLSGRPLSELLASGQARQIGDVEVSDEPIRTQLDPQ